MSPRREDDIDRLFNRERPIEVFRVDHCKEYPRVIAEVVGPFTVALMIDHHLHWATADRAVDRQLERPARFRVPRAPPDPHCASVAGPRLGLPAAASGPGTHRAPEGFLARS